jgi:hypothetical protein
MARVATLNLGRRPAENQLRQVGRASGCLGRNVRSSQFQSRHPFPGKQQVKKTRSPENAPGHVNHVGRANDFLSLSRLSLCKGDGQVILGTQVVLSKSLLGLKKPP